MYEISLDTEHKLLRLKLNGMWEVETLKRFEGERRMRLQLAGWKSGEFDCLVDLREHGVQTKEVAAGGQEIHQAVDLRPRKLAIIVAGAIKKMQVSRTIEGTLEQVFDDEHEALRWLSS